MSAFYDLASLVVVPSGYKSGKVYAQKPLTTDGQLAFTRASTATRVNASGLIEAVSSGVPRLDYTNSTCPKLLLEPSRTNLALQSSDFTDPLYTKIGVTGTANTITSPDGTANADSILEIASTGTHESWQRVNMISGQAYTQSCFFKANGRKRVQMQIFDNATQYAAAIYDLNSVTVVATNGTSTITNYGSGWYRCTISGISPATALGYCVIGLCTDLYATVSVQDSYAGDAAKGVYFWGMQTEAGAYATSYIPTTTAAVTRVTDAASKTGISSLIGQTEGTLFVDLDFTNRSEVQVFIEVGNGSTQRVLIYCSGNSILTFANASVFSYTQTANERIKIAFAYKSGSSALYVNGVQKAVSSGSLTYSSLSNLYLGMEPGGAQTTTNPINQALLFKTRLTNAQLAELTAL
jgi:hypothetical protein